MDSRVDKLNGTNYHNWKFNVRMLLTGKDLWEIVEGTESIGVWGQRGRS